MNKLPCLFAVACLIAPALLSATARAELPKWPGQYGDLKVLNSFVTELLSVPSAPESAAYSFLNPRKGWVFIALAKGDRAAPEAFLDERAHPLVWRVNPDNGAVEAMQLLTEGRHTLRVKNAANRRLDIRAVPELMYCYYPTHPLLPVHGPYTWDYLARYVLPHVNTIVSRSPIPPAEFDQWLREGRQWLSNASLPGLGNPRAPTVDEVLAPWAANEGVTQAGFAGMIVDEFAGSPAVYYGVWGDALKRLHAMPAFKDKTFYAWCGDLFRDSPEFSKLLLGYGDRFCREIYMHEQPTEVKAQALIDKDCVCMMADWEKTLRGVEQNLVITLGYMSAPPETLDVDPGVNFHAFLELQFETMANSRAFFGLYGIMEYMADYADEETVRYAHKLLRHYCIEGQRIPYRRDPYILSYLYNPDFEEGLDAWRTEPAEPGTINAGYMKGFSWLEGRYPRVKQGDHFCWMKRSDKAPNKVAQTIKGLEPGRLYSLKMYAADLRKLDQKQKLAISVSLSDAEVLDKYGFQCVYASSYSHTLGAYNEKHPAYFTWRRVVFRPKKETSELTISDWESPDKPGGPAGQETAFNFIEIQPFLEP